MKKLILLVALFALVSMPASAAFFTNSEEYSLSKEEVINEDIYISAGNVVVSGRVNGDVFSGGGSVLVNGPVRGDVTLGGGDIDVLSPIGDDLRVAGGQVTIGERVADDLIAAGGIVHVISGTTISGEAIVVGGRVVIEGTINEDLLIYADEVVLKGSVGGNAKIFSGRKFEIGENLFIGGDFEYHAPEAVEIGEGVTIGGETIFEKRDVRGVFEPNFAAIFGALSVAKLVLLLIAGLVAVRLFNRLSGTIGRNALDKTGKNLLVGFVTMVVIPVVIVLLFMSVLGLLLGAVGLLLFLLLLVVTKIYAGIVVGAALSKWLKKEVIVDWRWAVLGITALWIIGLVPVLEWLASAVFGLITFGVLITIAYEKIWKRR